MNQQSSPAQFDRRQVFRLGGLSVATAAVVAACGGTSSGVGRVGVAPTTTALPDASVSDIVLLRTAASIEYTAIGVYQAFKSSAPAAAAETIDRIVADHTAHADAVNQLITDLGGEPWTCGNPRLEDITVPAIAAAINGSDTKAPSDNVPRDVMNTAFVLETYAAETYQSFIPMLSDPALRQAAMTIGGEEARHAAILAIAITGSPEGYREVTAPDEPPQIPVAYAMPAPFGLLGGQSLVIGAQDEVGQRTTVPVDTPAANTFVYEYMTQSC
ncbi:MAG: ferritin-like domain-containing protein [Acidimicrobiales bacterium]